MFKISRQKLLNEQIITRCGYVFDGYCGFRLGMGVHNIRSKTCGFGMIDSPQLNEFCV